MIAITLRALAEVLGGALSPAAEAIADSASVTGEAVIDSRLVAPGDAFVAIVGENSNGHDYASVAIERGAAIVLATQELPLSVPALTVPDVEAALAAWARFALSRLDKAMQIVAVTGSVGKTTTKDLLAQVLGEEAPTIAPVASFNNEIGLPLTVLRADAATRFLILEMGASGPGHIKYLTSIARPDISVVLCVGSAHMGGFGGIEATARAKAEIVDALSADGVAILNADDVRVRAMAQRSAGQVVFFGESERAIAEAAEDVTASLRGTLTASDVRLDPQSRASFTLTRNGFDSAPKLSEPAELSESAEVTLSVHGEHQVSNALAVASVASTLGIDLPVIAERLSRATILSRYRMEVTHRPDGVTIVNDAYNANPESMRAALKSLAAMGHQGEVAHRTWAVLGEMLELGEDSREEHWTIGRLAVRLNISRLVAVGPGAAPIHAAALLEGSWGNESTSVDTADDALALLESELAPGDIVLVKSSNGVGLFALGDELATSGVRS